MAHLLSSNVLLLPKDLTILFDLHIALISMGCKKIPSSYISYLISLCVIHPHLKCNSNHYPTMHLQTVLFLSSLFFADKLAHIKITHILKTIKNATDIQVISTFQGHLVRFVYSEVSLPFARESFSEN